jgi:hypothetical protein
MDCCYCCYSFDIMRFVYDFNCLKLISSRCMLQGVITQLHMYSTVLCTNPMYMLLLIEVIETLKQQGWPAFECR